MILAIGLPPMAGLRSTRGEGQEAAGTSSSRCLRSMWPVPRATVWVGRRKLGVVVAAEAPNRGQQSGVDHREATGAIEDRFGRRHD